MAMMRRTARRPVTHPKRYVKNANGVIVLISRTVFSEYLREVTTNYLALGAGCIATVLAVTDCNVLLEEYRVDVTAGAVSE